MNTIYYLRTISYRAVLTLLGAMLYCMTSAAALVITTTQLPPDTNGIPYSQTITVSGG